MTTEEREQSGESWLDKLAVPVIILIVTALISGLVVPLVLGRIEDEKRRFDLQSRLIEQLVADNSAAQMSVELFRRLAAAHHASLVSLEREKRVLALRSAGDAERDAVQQELARERGAYAEASRAAEEALAKYRAEDRGNSEWVRLHYGDHEALTAYVRVTPVAVAKVIDANGAYVAALRKEYRDAAAALQSCTAVEACDAIEQDALAKIGTKAREPAELRPWNEALYELVDFVSRNEPRV